MTRNILDKRFGIMLMEGEELLFEATPTEGFVGYSILICCMTIIGVAVVPIVWLLAQSAKRQYKYWLTNRRVILSSGIIGHRVRSIPLERVSDVALSNTFPEMFAGISSVIVRDMTGESDSGRSLFAVENAPELQARILEEVQRVNAERRQM